MSAVLRHGVADVEGLIILFSRRLAVVRRTHVAFGVASSRVPALMCLVGRRYIRVVLPFVATSHIIVGYSVVELIGRPSLRLFGAVPLERVGDAIIIGLVHHEQLVASLCEVRILEEVSSRHIILVFVETGSGALIELDVADLGVEIVLRHLRPVGIDLDAHSGQFACAVDLLFLEGDSGIVFQLNFRRHPLSVGSSDREHECKNG